MHNKKEDSDSNDGEDSVDCSSDGDDDGGDDSGYSS